MKRYTLTVVDTVGIQDYIFGTNNLRQNVGASYLVDCATRKWVVDALPPRHNVLDPDRFECPFKDEKIEDKNLDAEVIYMGGGNALILFADHEEAIAFSKRLTRRVLLEAPGLNVVLAHVQFDWGQESLGGKEGCIRKVMTTLVQRKRERVASMPLLGLGVTASCAFTDLPAVEEDNEDGEGHLISAETQAKLQAAEQAHKRLVSLIDWHDYRIPKDFDDFGRTRGESSYIAVIHTDGNSIGNRIRTLRDRFPLASQNRDYIRVMRAFSLSLQEAAMNALRNTVERLVTAVQTNDEGEKSIGPIELKGNKLPFRPIVFGGDDVTFVCDGRLGLALAAYYLEQFSSQTLTDGKLAYARAGIAVVKTHYPFARAYALAEALCRSAKTYVVERQDPPYNEEGVTAMDWHFAVGGVIRDLEEIRNREYTVQAGKLFMRPVRLTSPEQDWRSWDTFSQIVRKFKSSEWAGRRNKVKALRDALRSGPDAVKHFLGVYRLDLPPIAAQPDMASQGWQGGRCGYFDAVEAIDFFIPLEGGEA